LRMDSQTAEVTRLLRAWGGGDHAALDRLTPLVYAELRRICYGKLPTGVSIRMREEIRRRWKLV
jgi:hypothetical protein